MKTENLVMLAVAVGGAALILTRKSEEEAVTDPSDINTAPEALPPVPPAIVTRNLPPLDVGLSETERVAVQNAVNRETIANNLNSFASTFEPMFPVAASVLRAKAAELNSGIHTGGEDPCCDDCADGSKPPCKGLPCDQKVTGHPIFAGLPKTLVGGR